MHMKPENLPTTIDTPGTKVQGVDWGGTTVSWMQFAAGVDFAPLFEGLPNDMCQCPHWGYLLKGVIHARYADGHEEIIRAGDSYYFPPGHTIRIGADAEYVEFSPTQEMNVVMEHVARKMNRS